MNRHERRRAAAIEHKCIPGYQHRLFSAYSNGLMLKRGGVSHAVIEHDSWCTIYKGAGCNCVPHITICGDGVTIVDTEGNGTTVRRS